MKQTMETRPGIVLETPSHRAYKIIEERAGGPESADAELFASGSNYLAELIEKAKELERTGYSRSSLEMKEIENQERLVAKIVEYYTLETSYATDLANRRGELERHVPGISLRLVKSAPALPESPKNKYLLAA